MHTTAGPPEYRVQPSGSLAVVGSGIRALHQMTIEARARIASSEKVFYAVCEPLTEEWINKTCAAAENLSAFYAEGKDRSDTYSEMIDAIMNGVRGGLRVCAVFYGHPGVYVYPSHECIRIARKEGYRAVMLPGISAEGSLYADLGVDPGAEGCLSYEATDFVLGGHKLDPSCSVILWQVDAVGDPLYHEFGYDGRHVPLLVEALLRFYDPDQSGFLYRAPVLSLGRAKIHPIRLGALAEELQANPALGTLYIPPAAPATIDVHMAERLGITP
jgi:tetrapyrrole (corrin/porphyrin) methylase-like protein